MTGLLLEDTALDDDVSEQELDELVIVGPAELLLELDTDGELVGTLLDWLCTDDVVDELEMVGEAGMDEELGLDTIDEQ